MRERRNRQGYDVAIGVVAFLGLYQGAVPLVVRLLFDGDSASPLPCGCPRRGCGLPALRSCSPPWSCLP
jgi:hypothetical protein